MKFTFISDTHGDFEIVEKAIKVSKSINSRLIHLGDLQLGFPCYNIWDKRIQKFVSVGKEPDYLPRFIRGNHDNPNTCRNNKSYLGDYGYTAFASNDGKEQTELFFVSGGWSFDKDRRIGIDWWPEEELNTQELQKAIALYIYIRPKIVISHTCPAIIAKTFLCRPPNKYYGARTENALSSMWEYEQHKPKYWIFGHWHREWRQNVMGTEFICLDINQIITLDL